MRVYQVLPTLALGDAVSNDAIALKSVIKQMGHETAIYAENIDTRLPEGSAQSVDRLPKLSKNDITIYHLSTGTKLNYELEKLSSRKIVRYHNITPPEFFEGYSEQLVKLCDDGLKGAAYVGKYADYCLAVSEFNRQDLIKMGYTCDIDVLPIVIPFEDYDKPADDVTINRYNDGYVNILFTGRIAPNKCQEDVIKAFYYYKKYYNEKSRLILVGSSNGMDRYYNRLKGFVSRLGLQDVIFPGHISFKEILAFYRVADVFLCQSEHEGFCVPLVEAMHFNVPVVAFEAAAIGETLGGGGVLLSRKNHVETAGMIDRIVRDEELRGRVIANQRERLADFSNETVTAEFKKYLNKFQSMEWRL